MATLSAVTGLTVDTTTSIAIFGGYAKAFIVNGTSLKVVDFQNTRLTSDVEITTVPSKGDILTQSGGTGAGATMVVDFLSSFGSKHYLYGHTTSSTAFTADGDIQNSAPANVIASGNLSSVDEGSVSSPLQYDWEVYNGDSENYGSLPATATLGCLYRGRCVLSGDWQYPHQWYMSRQADPWDWQYASTDAQTPVSGNNTQAGEVGDMVTALVPYGDDYLVFGCASSMWLMRGDPAAGGSLDELSRTTGIVGPNAWTLDDKGNLWFFGAGGLYVSARGQAEPENVSNAVLPRWSKRWALQKGNNDVALSFDPERQGIIISKTTYGTGENENYFYSLATGGFFPESYATDCAIRSSVYYDADDPDDRKLLVGCEDGFIREYDDDTKDDQTESSTEAIDSQMLLPIQPLGPDEDAEGRIISMTTTIAGGDSGGDYSDSDALNYEYHVGDSAEQVAEAVRDGDTALQSGSFTGTGRKNRVRKKAKGRYLGIKFYNSAASSTWAIENVQGEVTPSGD